MAHACNKPLRAIPRRVIHLTTALAIACGAIGCGHAPVQYDLPSGSKRRVLTGLEVFIGERAKDYRGRTAALVSNHSGVDHSLRANVELLRASGISIALAFAPEHGLHGHQNAYDTRGYIVDERRNLMVYNLHLLTVDSLRHLLRRVDLVIYDIQDMGMRCYTYVSDLKMVMDALAGTGTELVVLDRPNPLGFLGVDGPPLDRRFISRHIASFPAPFIYGLTIGEAARYYNGEAGTKVRLTVVPMKNYGRGLLYHETMLPWVPPSPNLPTYPSSIVYAGIVLLEGINLSVGRGTTKPFEYIGAPWIDPFRSSEALNALKLPSFRFRPVYFEPTFSKYKNRTCGGVQIFYTGGRFSPTEFTYILLRHLFDTYPECRWERAGGTYDIDVLAGTDRIRKSVDAKRDWRDLARELAPQLDAYRKTSARYHLYR